MSDMTQNNDISGDAVARLLYQFQDKTYIEGLVTSFTDQLQDIEDVIFDVRDDRWIDTASGTQLDNLGAIVGAERGGRSDADYKNLIIAQIGRNTSKGRATDIFTIFNLLTSSDRCYLVQLFPAAIGIYADHDITSLNTDDIKDFLELALAAGVSLDEVGYYLEDEAFGYDGDPANLGYGSTSDPSLGGKYASLV